MDRAQGYGTDGSTEPGRTSAAEPSEASVVVRSEERLRVGNQLVPVERVRVRRRVVTETRTVQVEVRREELVLERLPVEASGRAADSGPTGPTDPAGPREVVLELREEVPVVTTRVRPVERVWVWVARVAGTQQVATTLSREEIAIDDGTTTQVIGAGTGDAGVAGPGGVAHG